MVVHSGDMQNPVLRFRTGLGLTQDQLAAKSHVERTKISRAERGFAHLRRDEIRRIARVLRVRIRDLGGVGLQ